MSDENFLARWSRRKAEAAKAGAEKRDAESATPQEPTDAVAAASPEASSLAQAPDSTPTAADAAPDAVPEVAPFDPKDLPPIDSIGPDTDVSVFLRPGVPAELARAALRRAWAADPAIRDYIGLSENSWDFTAPQGVPGFGPLSPEDVQRLFAALTGQTQATTADERAAELPSLASSDAVQTEQPACESPVGPNRNQLLSAQSEDARGESQLRLVQPPLEPSSMQRDEGGAPAVQHIHSGPTRSRRGGGALPK
ncbi:MAG TPA: DUF3306 domain-containing protein [Xanthobacteraceae bacterium]|nr:DUF3306 domain-containing protein [Xanthobacteraceae bacterium]